LFLERRLDQNSNLFFFFFFFRFQLEIEGKKLALSRTPSKQQSGSRGIEELKTSLQEKETLIQDLRSKTRLAKINSQLVESSRKSQSLYTLL